VQVSADQVADVDEAGDGTVRCWCCGARAAPTRAVRLGEHPEVHLCLGCAHFVHQQAWGIEDEEKAGPASVLRERVRALRALVIRRGWHDNRFVGGRLRWLGKHLP
jgi:hypothetical protein